MTSEAGKAYSSTKRQTKGEDPICVRTCVYSFMRENTIYFQYWWVSTPFSRAAEYQLGHQTESGLRSASNESSLRSRRRRGRIQSQGSQSTRDVGREMGDIVLVSSDSG